MSLSDRLNKRVELWANGSTQDAIGQPIIAPVKLTTVYAEVLDKDGDMAVDADQERRTVKTTITIRARALPDVFTVRYKGFEYRVDAMLGTDNRTLKLAVIKIGKVPPP